MSDQSAERRRFDRIATDKPVVIHDGDTQHDGVVRDVSLQGMLFTLASDWRPPHGIHLHASVRLDGELCCIDMEGEVAHIEGADIGLHCLSLDVESAAKLRRMVELNLVDSALLERNLQQLIAG